MSQTGDIVYSAAPPPGIASNSQNPYHATGLVVVICVFLPLAIIATAIRTFTRTRIVHDLAFDDYVMIFALLTSIALSGCILDLLNYGLGKHLYDVPLDDLYPKFLKVNIIAAVLFCAATGMAKTSVLLFYRRIFPSRVFHWVVWAFVAFTVGYSAASVLVNIFSCSPIAGSWDIKYVETAKCINRPVFYFAQASLGILTDFATVIAPLPMMWKLQLPFRQKIGVAGILTMGGFVCVVSIIRLQSLYVLLKGTDLTVDTVNALLWCVVELNISIIGGCAPTLRPFIRRYFPSLLGSSSSMYATGEVHRDRSGQGQSHQLRSFDPSSGMTPKNTGTRVTTRGDETTKGENESEEYIFQDENNSEGHSELGKITRTVEYGYEEDLGPGVKRTPKS